MKHKLFRKLICMLSAIFMIFSALPLEVADVSAKAGEYRYWLQTDKRWNYVPVGSYYNVGSVGCLITSFAMIAIHSGTMSEDEMNPGIFTQKATEYGGFTEWGILLWNAIPKVVPGMTVYDKRYFSSSDPYSKAVEMQEWIDKGYYIICHCQDYYDSSGYYHSHWVFVEGASEGVVYMLDPASWNYSMFDQYYSGYATEYMIIQCEDHPSPEFMVQGASIDISLNSLPYKTDYQVGEELDLTGGEAVVSGTGYMGVPWELKPESMGDAMSFETRTDEFDSSVPDTYNIYLYAKRDRVEKTISFPVYVLDPETGERVNHSEIQTTVPYETTVVPESTETTCVSQVFESPKQYFSENSESVDVISSPDENGNVIVSVLGKYVVNVSEVYGNYGLIDGDDLKGWTDISEMSEVIPVVHAKGDINNDGEVNFYDLAVLNEYLRTKEKLPDNISILNFSEIDSADINSDGVIDESDVFEYLNKLIL